MVRFSSEDEISSESPWSLGGQASETVSEGIGNAEVHVFYPLMPRALRLQCFQFSPGMIRFMNSSNNGTVNAVSP